jgi:4-amino-4-deoxy-L-arabinose transferase-like glycosyltransferase
MKRAIAKWPVFALALITLWLKLANLGYSDYQGDELKALPASSEGLLDFLLQQRKGPTEFIVAYLVKLIDPTYANQFLARLPYALAGILAVYFFYKLVRLHYGEQVALLAALFFSINGLFIGLTRIVQYQSFVLLFCCLALYAFSLAIQEARWKTWGIYTGLFFWALALFTHYDGIFIAPFAIYLLYRWYACRTDLSPASRLKHLILPAAVLGLLLAAFYLPLFASTSAQTQSYWLKRLSGGGVDPLIHSSIATFNLYNPLQTIFLYAGLILLSLKWFKITLPVWAWLVFPWMILEVIVHDPGTHIYAYLLPGTILAAFGLRTAAEAVTKILGKPLGPRTNLVSAVCLFGFLFAVSHFIFVDHTPEYPWETRRILFWKVERPASEYMLWVFGFPYYRHWEEIGKFVASSQVNGYYWTNEKLTIASRYVPGESDEVKAGVYIHVFNPQSFIDTLPGNAKLRDWIKHHPPDKVFMNGSKTVAEVYILPAGSAKKH